MFSFPSTSLRIKRTTIHIGITDAKGSTESFILLLVQFCQLMSLSYPRGGKKRPKSEGYTWKVRVLNQNLIIRMSQLWTKESKSKIKSKEGKKKKDSSSSNGIDS